MARSKSISIPITGNSAPLRRELKKASQELTTFGKAQAAYAKASTFAYAAAGTAVAQFAVDSVRSALEDQKSQALLAKQLQLTTGARAAQIAGVEDYIESTMLATNITDDALRPALAQLVRVTGNATEAQKLLSLAADVSVGSGRELGSVVTALSRAYNGSTQGLTRLGITIDETAMQTRGFGAVTDELTAKFGGSATAAADTLAGRVENVGVRLGELKETLGTQLLPVVDSATTKLLDLAKAMETRSPKDLGGAIFNLGAGIADLALNITGVGIGKGLSPLNYWLNRNTDDSNTLADRMAALSAILVRDNEIYQQTADALEDQADAAARADREVGYLRDQYRRFSEVTLQIVEDEKKRSEASQAAAATARTEAAARKKSYTEQAKTLRESLGRALEDSKKQLQDAKDAADDFGRGLAQSFGVSLSSAYSEAKESEDAYSDALKGRDAAYKALDVAKQGDDLNAYLRAVQDVATAEEAVTAAQKARVSAPTAFAKQVEDAKTFGTNLKTLVGQGLGEAGLRQLLDLGPTAGAEVTKALLEGTAGFTVGGLNESLADLAGVQAGLAGGITAALAPKGQISAAQSMVDALSSASIGAPGVGQGFVINIQAGVGDPVAIGRQVKDVLGQYDNRAGSLIVQGGKKKKAKKK